MLTEDLLAREMQSIGHITFCIMLQLSVFGRITGKGVKRVIQTNGPLF